MGLGGISMWQLLIILVIVLAIFGTKRLRNIGGDLGGAIKSFRGAMADGEEETPPKLQEQDKKPDAEFSEAAEQPENDTNKSA